MLPKEFTPVERKSFCAHVNQIKRGALDDLLDRYSTLLKLKRTVAWLLSFKSYIRSKDKVMKGPLTVKIIKAAEMSLVKYVQAQEFAWVKQILENRQELSENPLRRKLKQSQQAKRLSNDTATG